VLVKIYYWASAGIKRVLIQERPGCGYKKKKGRPQPFNVQLLSRSI